MAYAPCAVLNYRIGKTGELPLEALKAVSASKDGWLTRLLNITVSIWPLSTDNIARRTLLLWRVGETNTTRMDFRYISLPGLTLPKLDPFDPRPHIERMWGVTLAKRQAGLALFPGDDEQAPPSTEAS